MSFDVGSSDQINAIRHRREDSVQRFLDRLGLAGQVEDQGVAADHPHLAREDGGGHEVEGDLPHLLAEAGQDLVQEGSHRFDGYIALGSPGAAAGDVRHHPDPRESGERGQSRRIGWRSVRWSITFRIVSSRSSSAITVGSSRQTSSPTSAAAIAMLPADFKYRTFLGMLGRDLVIIGGRPGMGKTAFCLNIAQHVGIDLNDPVAIFSLEMAKEQLVMRMLTICLYVRHLMMVQ